MRVIRLHCSCNMAEVTSLCEDICNQTVEEFNAYLEKNGFADDVLDSFFSNRISGSLFLLMEEEELKELVPIAGYRIKVRELL